MNSIYKVLLIPFGFIYYLITSIRNGLFYFGFKKSHSFSSPVICIGNLNVGGTGKTPHTEYFIRLLKKNYRIATLSRGYGRDTKGFIIASEKDNANTIGDEPFQLFQKFKNLIVAVDEKRVRGIKNLLKLEHRPDIIILDDAFQHRQVKAGLNILLSEYNQAYTHDYILPVGRLREPRRGAKRADILIITKCPKTLTAIEMKSFTIDLKLTEYQKVFYSYVDYGDLIPLNEAAKSLSINYKSLKDINVCLVSAIANPKPLEEFILKYNSQPDIINFPDHYYFREKDYELFNTKFTNLTKQKVLLLTEKDATKLNFEKLEKIPVFAVPIEIKFHSLANTNIDEEIINYVKSY